MTWADSLRPLCTGTRRKTRAQHDKDTDAHFATIYDDLERQECALEPSLLHIKRFHFQRAKSFLDEDLSSAKSQRQFMLTFLRGQAQDRFLVRKAGELFDNGDIEQLWDLLLRHTSPPMPSEGKMNYEAFRAVGREVNVKLRSLFSPSLFLMFRQDEHARISSQSFFNFAMRKAFLFQTRLTLSKFDLTGDGFLEESDVEEYILELIHTFPQLADISDTFSTFYVCTAVRKFFFFLDPMRRGRIAMKDLLLSNILFELFELAEDDLEPELGESNWFSVDKSRRIYDDYLSMDKDRDGLLSRTELQAYGTGTLTDAFLDRVFEECHTYGNRMDYKTYLDFVLAMENKNTPAGLAYFFRLLDFQHNNYLDLFTISYFFKDVAKMMATEGFDPINVDDVSDEIFDMLNPRDSSKITVEDLIATAPPGFHPHPGETVLNMLTDMHMFWTYDNRFTIAHEDDN